MIARKKVKKRSSAAKAGNLIVQKLVERSLFLTTLTGIKHLLDDAELNLQFCKSIANLQSISLGDVKFFEIRRGIPLENVVEFLQSTQSRTSLKELKLFHVVHHCEFYVDVILDRLARSFANCRGNQSPLMLEKFLFMSRDRSVRIRLDTLDTSRLIDVRLGEASIEPDQLSNMIERASNLRRIELSFLRCGDVDTNGQHLQPNKKLLAALASHESLTSIKLHDLSFNSDTGCMDFGPEFIAMLKTIGRRGKLRNLALENRFAISLTININELCSTIHEHIPYLRSIKLDIDEVTSEIVGKIVSLTEMEELHFLNWRTPLTASMIKQITQIPNLKRLAFDVFDEDDMNSREWLADAHTLMDLRIRFAYSISASVYETWSDGFASNLRVLMLRGVAANDKHDEHGFVRLLEKTVRLRVLIVTGNITDRSLMAIAKSCPELEILGVASNSKKISVRHLQEIVEWCPKLKGLGGFGNKIRNKLRLPKYRKISDVDLEVWREHNFDNDDVYD